MTKEDYEYITRVSYNYPESVRELFSKAHLRLTDFTYVLYLDVMARDIEYISDEGLYDMGYAVEDAIQDVYYPCTCGVYMIHNKDYTFKKIYCTKRLEEVWDKAWGQLAQKRHWSKAWQQAYNKYNGEVYIQILELCPSQLLRHAKQKWCDYYGIKVKEPTIDLGYSYHDACRERIMNYGRKKSTRKNGGFSKQV